MVASLGVAVAKMSGRGLDIQVEPLINWKVSPDLQPVSPKKHLLKM
jgi:thymidine phosphorylase